MEQVIEEQAIGSIQRVTCPKDYSRREASDFRMIAGLPCLHRHNADGQKLRRTEHWKALVEMAFDEHVQGAVEQDPAEAFNQRSCHSHNGIIRMALLPPLLHFREHCPGRYLMSPGRGGEELIFPNLPRFGFHLEMRQFVRFEMTEQLRSIAPPGGEQMMIASMLPGHLDARAEIVFHFGFLDPHRVTRKHFHLGFIILHALEGFRVVLLGEAGLKFQEKFPCSLIDLLRACILFLRLGK